MKPRIYLDNNATTFLDPQVQEVVEQHLKLSLGNPSSMHAFGQEARALLSKARRSLASDLQIKPNELYFTSGGTESINMVLRGLFGRNATGHLVTSAVEHACVYATVEELERLGTDVTILEPGLWGAVTVEAVQQAIRPSTRLIALMAVNNETGVKTDIEAIAAVAKAAHIPFLVDAVCLLGKELFTIPDGVSAMCFSGHKCHALPGIGMAYIRNTLSLDPILTGGEQEFGRRGGSENILGALSLAEAVRLLKSELPAATENMRYLRDKFEATLSMRLSEVTFNGTGPRVANTSNLAFEGIEGETLLALLDMEGVAASHGSACASGALEPSRILLNMGIAKAKAKTALRFSLSRFTTEAEIDEAIEIICKLVHKLRKPDVKN